MRAGALTMVTGLRLQDLLSLGRDTRGQDLASIFCTSRATNRLSGFTVMSVFLGQAGGGKGFMRCSRVRGSRNT